MELKEFIKKSLKEIDEALAEVSGEVQGQHSYKYGPNSSGHNTVDFDIQVYAEDKIILDTGVGINVAGIKIGANGESNNSNHNLSKINFSVVRQSPIKKSSINKSNRLDSLR